MRSGSVYHGKRNEEDRDRVDGVIYRVSNHIDMRTTSATTPHQ